jgi:hypothetical protein
MHTHNEESPFGPEQGGRSQDWSRSADLNTERLNRVGDYQEKALQIKDPLRSNIALLNGSLLMTAFRYDETITAALERGPLSPKGLQRIGPAIEVQLKLARQIDRFANFEQRMSKAEGSGQGNNSDPDASLVVPGEVLFETSVTDEPSYPSDGDGTAAAESEER